MLEIQLESTVSHPQALLVGVTGVLRQQIIKPDDVEAVFQAVHAVHHVRRRALLLQLSHEVRDDFGDHHEGASGEDDQLVSHAL